MLRFGWVKSRAEYLNERVLRHNFGRMYRFIIIRKVEEGKAETPNAKCLELLILCDYKAYEVENRRRRSVYVVNRPYKKRENDHIKK